MHAPKIQGMPQPDLIGSAEACQILGINRSTLTRWVATDRITYWVKLPGETGAMLFDRAVVETLAAETDEAAS